MFLCCELKWSTRDFDEIKIPFLNGFYSCQSFKDLDQKNFLANSLNHVQSPFPFRCSSDGEGDVKRLLQVPAKMHVTRISLIADKCSDFFSLWCYCTCYWMLLRVFSITLNVSIKAFYAINIMLNVLVHSSQLCSTFTIQREWNNAWKNLLNNKNVETSIAWERISSVCLQHLVE